MAEGRANSVQKGESGEPEGVWWQREEGRNLNAEDPQSPVKGSRRKSGILEQKWAWEEQPQQSNHTEDYFLL